MHGAPPVQMVCGSDPRWYLASWALASVAATVALQWLVAGVGARAAVVWLGAAPVALLGWLWSVRRKSGRSDPLLVWDGRSWLLDGRPGQVEIAIDLGSWMLLRFHDSAASGVTWLPLPLQAAGAPVAVCRAALHAHAGAAGTAHKSRLTRGGGG